MKHDDDNRWLDPMLERHIQREPETFDFEKWAEKHPDEARLLRCGFQDSSRSAKTRPFEIWRFIMESKVTRYSAAAVIVLAMAVLLSPFGTPGNGGIVLADVQQRVAEFETMVQRGKKTFLRPGKEGDVFEFNGMKCEFDIVKYFSKQHGFTEEGRVKDNLIYRITFNLPERQTLIAFPPDKKYVTFSSADDVAKIMETITTPSGFLNLLLGSGYKKLGRNKIDDVEVEGFEFRDIESIKQIFPKVVFDIQDYTGRIWIGIKEQLPIRIEGDLVIGKSFMTMFNDLNLHEVNILDQYNVELDEGIFSTNAPEGYTEFTLSDILPLIPLEAKAGLAGLGIAPAGIIFWKRRKRKRASANQN